MPSPSATPSGAAEAGLGLRERKKQRTRQSIRDAARRLIDRQGYDQTTIEQIAAAAEVAPATIFRHFRSKEQIVLTYDFHAGIEALHARPAAETPLVALRATLTEFVRALYEDYNTEYRWRRELVRTVPVVRAQLREAQDQMVDATCTVLAERTGRPADDLELRVVVGCMVGALDQVLWGEHRDDDDLLEMFDRALDVLERGLTL